MLKNSMSVKVNGRLVTIRPICLADAAMETEFVRHLSPQTRRYRFFGALNDLSAAEAKRLCDVDGEQTMAYVASVQEKEHEVEIAVCRYAPTTKPDVREMAITVADEWQHTELAAILLEQLMKSAKQHGIRELYTVELSDNLVMHDFARDLGMTTKRDPDDATQVIYSMPI